MKTIKQFLNEALIRPNNGKKYGQVILLAGGGGSGKSFAAANMIDSYSYRSLNPDEFMHNYSKLAAQGKTTRPGSEKFSNINWRNPLEVQDFFSFFKDNEIFSGGLQSLFNSIGKSSPEFFPNLLFDKTFKEYSDIISVVEPLCRLGYKPKNVHLIWVLTDFRVSIMRNRTRTRIVPDDVLLNAHAMVAQNMHSMFLQGTLPPYVDGDVYVIINGDNQVEFMNNQYGQPMSGTELPVVFKSFKYFHVKKSGKPFDIDFFKSEVLSWIRESVPKTDLTKSIFE